MLQSFCLQELYLFRQNIYYLFTLIYHNHDLHDHIEHKVRNPNMNKHVSDVPPCFPSPIRVVNKNRTTWNRSMPGNRNGML